MTADRTPSTEAGRIAANERDGIGYDYASRAETVRRIEAEAIDGRVAALVEALDIAMDQWGDWVYSESTGSPEDIPAYAAARALLSDLATAAAERDERLAQINVERLAKAMQAYDWPTGPRRSIEEYRLIAEKIAAEYAAFSPTEPSDDR